MSPDQTTKTASSATTTTSTDAASRKRRSEVGGPPTAKRTPRSPKEEKENEVNQPTSSSSPSILPITVEESMDPPIIIQNRRKNRRPARLEDVQKTLKTSKDPKEIQDFYERNQNFPSDNVRFLVQNMVQKKALLAGKAICREREEPKIRSEADRILDLWIRKEKYHLLASLDFTNLNSWGNSMDASNYETSAARMQFYAVIFNNRNSPQVTELGMGVISIAQNSLREGLDAFNTKKVYLSEQETNEAVRVYIVVVVKRNAVKEERRGATRIAAAAARSVNAKETPLVIEQQTRIGAYLMYDQFGYKAVDGGVQRIILVDSFEKPEFEAIFTEMLTSPTDWMKQAHNLELLHQRNSDKLDQHLPRLVFLIEPTNFKSLQMALKDVKQEPVMKTEPIDNDGQKFSRMAARMDTRWLNNRFPCYEFIRDEATGAVRSSQNDEYFETDIVDTHRDLCFYRPQKDRSKGSRRMIRRGFRSDSEEPMDEDPMDPHGYIPVPPQNIGPDGRKLTGLEFKMPRGHSAYAPCTFGSRAADVVPHLDVENPKTYRKELFIHHNPRVYTEFGFRKTRLDEVPPEEFRKYNQDIYVVEEPVTQEQIDSYNKELDAVKVVKKLHPGSILDNDMDRNLPGMAKDGYPVPKFSEMFFPTGKTEIYNILLRYYQTEVGHRAGSFAPEWRSRVLTGFVEKYYKHIFTHNLSDQFEKQLQCMAFTSHIPWKPVHFNRPWNRLNELRNEWEAEHPSSPTRALRSRRPSSPGPAPSRSRKSSRASRLSSSPSKSRRASSPGPSSQPSTSSNH